MRVNTTHLYDSNEPTNLNNHFFDFVRFKSVLYVKISFFRTCAMHIQDRYFILSLSIKTLHEKMIDMVQISTHVLCPAGKICNLYQIQNC